MNFRGSIYAKLGIYRTALDVGCDLQIYFPYSETRVCANGLMQVCVSFTRTQYTCVRKYLDFRQDKTRQDKTRQNKTLYLSPHRLFLFLVGERSLSRDRLLLRLRLFFSLLRRSASLLTKWVVIQESSTNASAHIKTIWHLNSGIVIECHFCLVITDLDNTLRAFGAPSQTHPLFPPWIPPWSQGAKFTCFCKRTNDAVRLLAYIEQAESNCAMKTNR